MPEITTSDTGLVAFRQDFQQLLRRRVLEALEIVLEEELSEALGSARYERIEGRKGYRNGTSTLLAWNHPNTSSSRTGGFCSRTPGKSGRDRP